MFFGQESPDAARVNRFEYTAPDLTEDDDASLWAAAFRQENDVVNAFALWSRQTYEPEPGFDYQGRAKQSQLFLNNADSFVGVQSNAEWNAIEQRLLQEQKDRAIMHAAGLPGVGAAMAAGILSPTVLLPGGLGARAATVSGAAASSAAWALVGVGAQEIVLQTNQDMRTAGESAVSIGTGVVAASLLGGAIRWASGPDLARIEAGMDATPNGPSIQHGLEAAPVKLEDLDEQLELYRALGADEEEVATLRQSLSAATNTEAQPAFDDAGTPDLASGGFGWLGPVTRGAMSSYPSMRSAMNQLSTGGISREGNREGVPTAWGGDVESRKMMWQANMATAIEDERKLFYDWFTRTGKGGKFRGWLARSEMERFSTEVGRAMEMRIYGQTHAVPEIAAAADRYIEKAFMPLIRQAKEAGMPAFQNLSDLEALKIAHQKVNAELIWKDREAVESIVKQNALRQLQTNPDLLKRPKVREWLELDEAAEGTTSGSRVLQLNEYADAVAAKILAKWEGSFNKHGTIDTINEVPVPREFVYIDPNASWRVRGRERYFGEFLERNVEKIARGYTRSMAGDVELFQRFGTVTPNMREAAFKAPFWTDIQKEFEAKIKEITDDADLSREQKEKLRLKEEIKLKAFERDFEVVVNRIRHIRGQPDDPRAAGFRIARALINLNTVRLMGTVAISSIPDIGRLVMKHGFMNLWRDALIPMFKDLRTISMGFEEAKYSGASLDVTLHGRSNSVFDLFEEAGFGNSFERGLQTATNYIGTVALFDYWNKALKGMASNLLIADMSRAMQRIGTGKAGGRERRFLAALGIDESLAKRMWKKMTTDGGEEVRPGIWYPNTEDWGKINGQDIYNLEKMSYREGLTDAQIAKAKSDAELARVYRAALARGIVDTIITPGVERPNWVDSSATARIIGQFRSFGLSSTLKSGVAAAQDARNGNFGPVLSGMSFSLALGAVSYYLWAMGFGPDSPQAARAQREFDDAINGDEDALARLADEAIARSGLLGVLEEVRRVGERIPVTQDAVTFANTQTTRSPYNSPVTETLGPTVGLLGELDRIFTTIDDPTENTFDAMRRLTPYQNVFYLRWAIDNMLYGNAKEFAGVK